MNLAMVNASKPDKHWLDPTGPVSACSWVNASMNLDIDVNPLTIKHWNTEIFEHLKLIRSLQLHYESGLGEHEQGWVGLVKTWNRGMKHLTI